MICLSALAMSGTMLAQKPASDDAKYSLEGNINYDAANGISWTAPNLRMRYFVNDNIAARVQLALGSTSDKTNVYEAGGDGTGSYTDKMSNWGIQLGAEYHLAGTEKMSPYFMAGFSYGMGSMTTNWENYDGTDYLADYVAEVKSSTSSLGFGIGAGMDYYLADNIYMGLELGWGWMSMSDGGGSADMNGTVTDTDPAGSSSGMGIGEMNTAFRIGWRF